MDTVKVSFIIPAYNVQDYLEECLYSVLKQNIEKEIIIIDDGSTDETPTIIQSFVQQYHEIIVITQENQGLSCSRNNGVRVATGEYLCFLDADDYYLYDFASSFYDLCSKQQLDVIRGWYSRVLSGNRSINVSFPVDYVNKVMNGTEYLKACTSQHALEVVSVTGFIKREYFIKNDLWFEEGLTYEDQLYFLKMLLCISKNRVMQTDSCFYGYRIHEGSITTAAEAGKAYDLIEIMSKQKEFIHTCSLSLAYQRVCYQVMSCTINHFISIWLRLNKSDRREVRHKLPSAIMFQGLLFPYNKICFIKVLLFLLCPSVLDRLFQQRTK